MKLKPSRRQLLQGSVGALQMALLGQSGSAFAQVGTTGPTKLLTLFLEGGWMSPFAMIPYDANEIATVFPAPFTDVGEPIFFTPSQVTNIDGTSMPNRIKIPALYADANGNATASPHGMAWKAHSLFNNAMVVHGVDQGAVAHVAGQVSALCGVASSEFRSPAINALAAYHLSSRFPDRPIPSVHISGPEPLAVGLPSVAERARITRQSDIDFLYSTRLDRPWMNLRASDINSQVAPVLFNGSSAGAGFNLNPIEDRTMRRLRELKNRHSPATENYLEQMHNSLVGVSRVLARDVANAVQLAQGVQYLQRPSWAPASGGYFGVNYGSNVDAGTNWSDQFNLALKLLKSNVCSSVAVGLRGANNFFFDAGHTENHPKSFFQARIIFEVIGRLLAEMKATPGPTPQKSLLDDCVVLVISDFARTLPKASTSSDHWAANSVLIAGGGLSTNKTIGGYIVPARPPDKVIGHDGKPVAILESTGIVNRVPRSADVITTVLSLLGVSNVRIPGGNGVIQGVAA
jgi:hypothetical protein